MARFVFRGIIGGDEVLDLYFSPDSEASNKLDYIYGLLAVTKSPITPDYTKSIREVTLEFMAWVLPIWKATQRRGERTFSFLNLRATGLKRVDDLPSWAPVFSKADRRRSIARVLAESCHAYGTVPELSNGLPIDIVGDSLWIKGIMAQTVMSVHDEHVSVNLLTTGLQKFIMEFIKSPQDIYPTGKSVFEVLYCTSLHKEKHDHYAFDIETGRGNGHKNPMLFKTKDGYIGTMPDDVLLGDVVCVLAGSRELAVLRPEDDHYLFVGCYFMIGLMNGEVSELLKSGKAKIEEIEIR
ncbi:heterokaryon incompatibility protein het-6 [Fusarium denticulatum]|uniref:Heterokaryon incompatibility protein het-6 n=1 Tax=Fusarium denticulatum TaxID=48507 RepID=A0A8H5UKK5_9HYPO|nr:heterokaryon incompatibility protein het-6 [Fusarium denticulatum]